MRLTRHKLERRLGDWGSALKAICDLVAAMLDEGNTELKDEDGLENG